MNIFLDTTLTYQDPYLKSISNNTLLKLVHLYDKKIYISRVALEETKQHLRKNISREIKELKKSIDKYNRICKDEKYININENIEEYIEELDGYYNNLQERGILEILDYNNDILPILVERAIKRIKPFDEKKDEFRDAIIWLTYANYINENKLEDCYFITNNTGDYYDNDNISLHPDLKKDCDNIKLVKSANELIINIDKTLKEILEVTDFEDIEDAKVRIALEQWIKGNKINEDSIRNILSEECYYKIVDFINNYFYDGNIPSNIESVISYLELNEIESLEVKDIHYEIIKDEIYISGEIELKIYADLMVYNPIRDHGEDRYSSYGSGDFFMIVEFSLTHEGENGIGEFEINKILKFIEINN